MCSITGFIVLNKSTNIDLILDHYIPVLDSGFERGRDSVGVVTVDIDGSSRRKVGFHPENYAFVKEAVTPKTCLLIGNNRAEPTTEYMAQKTQNDIQPFGDGGIYVSHNGIIANDKELKQKYNIETNTSIDTAICPGLIRKLGIHKAIHQLVGSYALAIVDTHNPKKLWLACNYKPIYLQARADLGAIFFASRPSYLLPDISIEKKLWASPVIRVPPYHLLEIDGETGCIQEEPLTPRASKKKAFVICSGGLDSTTAAKWAQIRGYEITLLHFLYQCRAQEREVAAVHAIAKELNCDYRFEDLSWLGRLGGSPLTDLSMGIAKNESGAEFAHEWVPARNLVFTGMAASLCDRYGYDTLVMGLNLEEAGAYPDNTVEFYEALDHVCDIGTISRPQILSPLGNLVKHQIVQMAIDIEAPIHLSWSCYYGGERHCGHCGPCFMRRTAFKMLSLEDFILYEH